MNNLKIIAIGLVSLVAIVAVLQNTQAVETKLLFLTLTLPNAALLFGTLIVGFAIGVFTTGHIVSRSSRRMPNEPRERAANDNPFFTST